MNNAPDNTSQSSTFAEKMRQPSNVSIGSVMLYAFSMGVVALGATRFEPITSHPRLAIPLYIFAGLFALIIVASVIYGLCAGDTAEADGADA